MTTLQSAQDLAALLAGRVPLVVVETRDEGRALAVVADSAHRTGGPAPVVLRWTVTDGLAPLGAPPGSGQHFTADVGAVLKHIRDSTMPAVYVLLDVHPFLTDPVTVRLLKDVCLNPARVPRTLVLVSHRVELPPEVEHLAARVEVLPPDRAEREAIVDRAAHEWARSAGRPVDVDPHARALLVQNLGGLSAGEAERLARGAVLDGALAHSDLPTVMQAKYELLARGGVLTYEYDLPPVEDVGGMGRLVRWLRMRRAAFDGSTALEPPRGVLLLGVQGCGKSMAAKAAAGVLGVPLLRLDLAAVHNKYVGESERILRETLATAEVLAPCVLWVDEVEKALADDADSGAGRRVLGTFLTWLAERPAPVFVVATANDVSGLPPELVRKGRFDELFFVDLPDDDARGHILRVHAARRGIALTDADVAGLAAASAGHSGAELEQAVVSALYTAHADGAAPTAAHVWSELVATRPLSVVMAERVAALRAWASTRTVPAAD
ncbi:AAA family ATPase [Cellulomonas carbonis]|uniref:AAA family ATPase n=1 Tax=Cellulomonas carbonis TaxID=1386092 RepID=UPI000694ADD8|nr:AAA family ATPase [Cellulomonas carbonis]